MRSEREPTFRNPPAVEVVLAVAFDAIPGFGTVQLGLLWQKKFRVSFPQVEEHPTYHPSIEQFEIPPPTSYLFNCWPVHPVFDFGLRIVMERISYRCNELGSLETGERIRQGLGFPIPVTIPSGPLL